MKLSELPWGKDKENPIAYKIISDRFSWTSAYSLDGREVGKVYKYKEKDKKWFRKIKWNSGYGGMECPFCVVWTEKYVYYVHEYDGSTEWKKLPVKPPKEEMEI